MSGPAQAASIWDKHRLWVTVGAVALIFLAALESLAVTTVMPVVSEALDGEALYAVAFAGTLATSVIGMVASGAWSDRRGPRGALYVAASLFIIGLLISGFAFTMHQFLVGRLVQGLGAGGQTVALYVIVARLYPPHLHGKVFAAFAAAWVIPSMIGPFLAGAVAEFLDWRWAFLGVAVLTFCAFLSVVLKLRGVDLGGGDASENSRVGMRLVMATLVAVAAVVIGFTADAARLTGWSIAFAAMVVIGFAIRPLVPRGTLRAAPGLPSVVLMRGIVAGAFFGGEAYIPYLLIDQFGFTPTWAGVALMLAAIAWAGGSAIQGQFGERLGRTRIVILALGLVIVALLCVIASDLLSIGPAILIVGWGFGGGGMGLLYPRLTVLTLAYSNTSNQGFNSAALSISDATGASVALALIGLGFAALGGGTMAFAAVFAFCIVLALIAAIPGLRLGHAAESFAPTMQ